MRVSQLCNPLGPQEEEDEEGVSKEKKRVSVRLWGALAIGSGLLPKFFLGEDERREQVPCGGKDFWKGGGGAGGVEVMPP